MRILIAPVGEQPTPNLIPLFIAKQQQQLPYDYVQFLASGDPRISQVAEHLHEALAVDPEMKYLEKAPTLHMDAWDLTKARKDFAGAIQKAIEYSNKKDGDPKIIVNLTGGTKIMSLAAYQAACEVQVPMVYVNTANSELIRFDKNGVPAAPQSFRIKIPIKTQLRAAGKQFKKNPIRPIKHPNSVPSLQANFVKWLVSNYDAAYEKCLKKIIINARESQKRGQIESTFPQSLILTNKGVEALNRLQGMSFVCWNKDSRTIRIEKKEAWEFIDGGWVEIFALVSLSENGTFDEVIGHVEIEGFAGEIDVIASFNGRIAIVECKTKGPNKEEGATFMAAKLRQHEMIMGGPYAKSFFVLASNENIGEIKKVSAQYGISNPIYESPQEGISLKDLPTKVWEGLRS